MLGALVAALLTLAVGGTALAAPAPRPDFSLGGAPCRLIAVPAASPVGAGACPGVRPGAIVQTEKGMCSLNFLFKGSDGRRYVGTAGHCILGDSPVGDQGGGEKHWSSGSGPSARDAADKRIGEFAYAALQDPKDFSLIRLDSGVGSSPAMCHFGGPVAVNRTASSGALVLHHFGNGIGISSLLPARTSLALSAADPDHVFATGAAAPGDSGSGVLDDSGKAVGVLVTVGVHLGSIGSGGVDAGLIGITRLAPQVARAESVLGISLELLTAPLA